MQIPRRRPLTVCNLEISTIQPRDKGILIEKTIRLDFSRSAQMTWEDSLGGGILPSITEALEHPSDHDASIREIDVLIVGDENRSSALAESLQDHQLDITTRCFDDASHALDVFRTDGCDAVISVYELSSMNGLEFLRAVRRVDPDLPFLLCPEEDSENLASDAVAADVTEYLPASTLAENDSLLAERLTEAIVRARNRREHRETYALFQSLTQNAPFAVLTIDEDSIIRYANDGLHDVLGYDPNDVVGDSLTRLMPDRFTSAHRSGVERYLETGEPTLDWSWVDLPGQHADGHEVPLGITFGELVEADRHLFTAIIRDVAAQKQVEAERQLLTETIRAASEADSLVDGLQAVIEEFCHTFELAYGEAWIPASDGDYLNRTDAAYATAEEYESFKATSGVTKFGPEEGLPGRAWSRESVVWMENVSSLTEEEFPRVEAARAVGLKAAFGLPIFADDDLVAVLAFYKTDEEPRDDRLVNAASTVASELGRLFERKQKTDALQERERELQQQRDELEQLDRLNGIIRQILSATVRAESQEEVEVLVCERLLEEDLFQCAWIGNVDLGSNHIHSQFVAGVSESAIADYSLSLDDASQDIPIVRAVQTGDVVVGPRDLEQTAEGLWDGLARESDARFGAAIPLISGEWFVGVLAVFTDRQDAFGQREQDVLGELGKVIGKTIRARQQQEALLNPTVVELTFRSRTLSEVFDEANEANESDDPVEISVEGVVPDGDRSHQFLLAEGISEPAFTDVLESLPTTLNVETIEEGDSYTRVKATMRDRALAEIFADVGGRLESLRYDDGSLLIHAQIPSTITVRSVLETLEKQYPDIELLSQVYVERTQETMADYRTAVRQRLTDRQQIALELAYNSGYFEWPRDATGEEVAALMDISAATFTQHLRGGHRKLLEVYFDD